MGSKKSKDNRECGCGEGNYSFTVAQKRPDIRIYACRKCSHRWLVQVKVKRDRKAYNPNGDRDE